MMKRDDAKIIHIRKFSRPEMFHNKIAHWDSAIGWAKRSKTSYELSALWCLNEGFISANHMISCNIL